MAIAIFDLDDTIIDGACDILWNQFMIDKGLVDHDWFNEQLAAFNQLLINDTLRFEDYIEFISASYFMLHPATAIEYCEEFQREILQPRIRHQVVDWMYSHKTNDDTVLICTASFAQVSNCIMALLPADHLIASKIEAIPHQTSYNITVCHGIEKPKLIQHHLKHHGGDLSGSWGYSDSFRDAPLLTIVDYAVAVNPCEKLQVIATANDWEIRKVT